MNRFILSFVTVVFAVISSSSQTAPKHKGIEMYEQGKYAEAVTILDSASKGSAYKSDSEIWNHLGLAYLEVSEPKKAVKAFEKTVKINAANSIYRTNLAYAYLTNRQQDKARSQTDKAIELDPTNTAAYNLRGRFNLSDGRLDLAERDAAKMIEIDPTFPPGYTLRADVLVAQYGKKVSAGAEVPDEISLLEQAVETLEIGAKKSVGQKGHQNLSDSLDGTRALFAHFSKPKPVTVPVPVAPEPGVTPFKILSKPPARYTSEARSAGIEGTIRMAVTLGADGRIKHALVLKGLGYGLDEVTTAAARQIKFEPKKVDGKPVTAVVRLEYVFNLY